MKAAPDGAAFVLWALAYPTGFWGLAVFFRILFAFDATVTLIILYFFFAVLADGSVSAFNAGIWAIILAVLAGIMGGGWWLHRAGQRAASIVTLLLLAVPGGLYAFFLILVVTSGTSWN